MSSTDPGPRDDAEDRAIARALGINEAMHEGMSEGMSEEDGGAMDETLVREYQEVLAHLPFEEKAPPPALEARVLAAARAQRAPAAPSIDRARRRRGAARFAAAGAAIAAAAAIAVFAITSDGDGGGPEGRIEEVSNRDEVAGALAEPGTRIAALDGVGSVALTAGGEGFLYDLALPGGTSYTLWLRTAGGGVRVGDLDPVPAALVKFAVSGAVDSVLGVYLTAGGTEVASATF